MTITEKVHHLVTMIVSADILRDGFANTLPNQATMDHGVAAFLHLIQYV
jgi:hypothetical protein